MELMQELYRIHDGRSDLPLMAYRVTEGGRRFMTEWRKEEEEKCKSRREERTAK